jgi:hypothetical protein
VALQIDRDDQTIFCQLAEQRTEHVDRAQAAMEQQQRFSVAVDLVVGVDAVDGRATGRDGAGGPARLRAKRRRAREPSDFVQFGDRGVPLLKRRFDGPADRPTLAIFSKT